MILIYLLSWQELRLEQMATQAWQWWRQQAIACGQTENSKKKRRSLCRRWQAFDWRYLTVPLGWSGLIDIISAAQSSCSHPTSWPRPPCVGKAPVSTIHYCNCLPGEGAFRTRIERCARRTLGSFGPRARLTYTRYNAVLRLRMSRAADIQ